MPAPAVYFYEAQSLIDAQQAFLDRVDLGVSTAKIRLRDESDVLLAEIPLTDPAGTIDGAGQLAITASGPDTSANNSGDCSYGEICDSDNNVRLTIPAESGATPVSGKIVLSNTTIAAGAAVSLVSCTIG